MMDPKELEVAKIMCALEKEWMESDPFKIYHIWLAEKIAKEEKGERWVPQNGDHYIFVDDMGKTLRTRFIGINSVDRDRLKRGNCYLTYAEAEIHAALVRAAYIADVE